VRHLPSASVIEPTPRDITSGSGDQAHPPASEKANEARHATSASRDPLTVALSDALSTVGDRWTLLVVAALLDSPRRFGELQSDVHGIAPNVLSQRLRHLERHGLLIARPYSQRPPRFTYELTTAGHELAGTLRLLADWGARNTEEGSPRHAVCGTAVQARWWCPTCERPIDEQEIGEVHFA
jgi:DNA-binding HxlR family transcriptional regulator